MSNSTDPPPSWRSIAEAPEHVRDAAEVIRENPRRGIGRVLRPDGDGWSKNGLHQLYSALPASHERWTAGVGYSFCCDPALAPVRCVGVARKGSAIPRMHHKFLVFCRMELAAPSNGDEDNLCELVPYRVWTGSFNATENGVKSLENAVVIDDEKIARAYLNEYQTLFGLSEPLAWETDWVQPEYRIGS